jgi:plasmid stabilization system protein ParE
MPAHYRVIILPRASADIHGICSFIEQEQKSPQNAALVAQRLIAAIDSLEILPHRYRIHEHRKDSTKSVRSMPVPPFIIYYRIDDSNQTVRVLTVWHGARRQPKRFR